MQSPRYVAKYGAIRFLSCPGRAGIVSKFRAVSGTACKMPSPTPPKSAKVELSYVNVGIFWNNHHHMMHATAHIDGRVLWANLFLLFWLSLIPFVIRWIDEAGLVALPVAAYGIVLFMAGVGYSLLQRAIVARNGRSSALAVALGSDLKGNLSIAIYAASIPLAFLQPWISIALYVVVALMWLVPDRRIESAVK